MQLAVSICIAFIPVAAFYLLYRRYSVFLPNYASHFLQFLIGAAAALLLALINSLLVGLEGAGPWETAFFRASLPERSLVFAAILFSPVLRARSSSLSEKIAVGILTGIGFGAVENILYGIEHGFQIVMPRLLIPVPLHAALGAFAAHWIGMSFTYRHRLFRILSAATALCGPVILHTVVDALLFGGHIYAAGAVLLCVLLGLDYTMARVQMVPPQEVLDALGMSYEVWKLVHDESSYERWIMQEHGAGFQPERIFVFRLSAARGLSIAALLLVPVVHTLALADINFGISPAEQRLSFVVFPLFLAANVALIGQVNPGYFRHGQIRIPITVQVQMGDSVDWASSVRVYGIFVRSPEPLAAGPLTVTVDGRSFSTREFQVTWENHRNVKRLYGSVVFLPSISGRWLWFVLRVSVRQVLAGIRYRARLPGFKDIAGLFMRPETVGQDLRFFPAGTQLFQEGEEGDTFFLIRKGSVSVYRQIEGKKLELALLGPGDLFGEMAITGHVPRNASAVCQSDCILAVGERDSLDRLIRSNVQFARRLIEMAAARFHDTQHKVTGALERIEAHEKGRKVLEYAGLILLLDSLGFRETVQLPVPDKVPRAIAGELIQTLGRSLIQPEQISKEARRLSLEIYRTRRLRLQWKRDFQSDRRA